MAAKKRRPGKAVGKQRGTKRRRKKAPAKSSSRSKKAPVGKARRAESAKHTTTKTRNEAYARRKDYGASVDAYVADLPPVKREIVNALRKIVKDAVPGVEETIRWGMPVFTRKKLICYASPKADYVRFGFYARVELDDPDQRIAGSLAYVKLNDANEIETSLLHSWVQQVVEHTGA